jgi:hypothetical protein
MIPAATIPSMADGAQGRVALVCGDCPNRRVLADLVPDPARPDLPSVAVGRPHLRPSIGGATYGHELRADVLRRRCKRGHAWSIPASELHEAWRAAVAAGRRDIVAGVDVAAR